MQAMPEPARPHLGNLRHLRRVLGNACQICADDARIGAVEHPDEDRFPALPRTMPKIAAVISGPIGIGERVAEARRRPRAEQHGQAGQPSTRAW